MTAVAPPPIAKKAETISKIPIGKYKSKSSDSLINNAPLNKSALKLKKYFIEIYVNMDC